MSKRSQKSHFITPDLERFKVKFNKRFDVYNWGDDNLYPHSVEALIASSPTATQCSGVLSDFINGSGWAESLPFNTEIGHASVNIETPDSLLAKTADDISKFKAFAWHLNYNWLVQVVSITHVPISWVRFGKSDDDLFSGKIAVYNNWDKSFSNQIQQKDINWFDAYNPRKEIIQAQMIGAGGFENWAGQILVVNLAKKGVYPLSYIDPVMNDVDTEAQISLFQNKEVGSGFYAAAVVRHAPFDDENDENDFKTNLQLARGAKGAGSIILLEDEFNSDKPDGNVRIDTFDRKFDAKGFEYTEKSISNKIRRVFNNVPPVLIDFVEGQLGNTSGESLKIAIDFYNKQTIKERNEIEKYFNDIMKNFAGLPPQNWMISPFKIDTNESVNQQI